MKKLSGCSSHLPDKIYVISLLRSASQRNHDMSHSNYENWWSITGIWGKVDKNKNKERKKEWYSALKVFLQQGQSSLLVLCRLSWDTRFVKWHQFY